MPRCPDNTNANPTIDPGTRHALTSNQPRGGCCTIAHHDDAAACLAPHQCARPPRSPSLTLALSSSPGFGAARSADKTPSALFAHLHTLRAPKRPTSRLPPACAPHTSLTPTATAGVCRISAHRCRRRRHRTARPARTRSALHRPPPPPPPPCALAVARGRPLTTTSDMVSFSMISARSTRNFAASAP